MFFLGVTDFSSEIRQGRLHSITTERNWWALAREDEKERRRVQTKPGFIFSSPFHLFHPPFQDCCCWKRWARCRMMSNVVSSGTARPPQSSLGITQCQFELFRHPYCTVNWNLTTVSTQESLCLIKPYECVYGGSFFPSYLLLFDQFY